jgi:prepilin-type N-terminal cleavage/methylation domain-containing protein
MRKNKNKGYSLLELLIAVSVLAVISVILVPSLHHFTIASKEKADAAAVGNVQTTVHMALQSSQIYHIAKDCSPDVVDQKLTFVYVVNEDHILTLDRIDYECADSDKIDILSQETAKIQTAVSNYVNGKLEPIEIGSEAYRLREYHIVATFPDVDYKVNLELEMVDISE